jgi:hypothetical protein
MILLAHILLAVTSLGYTGYLYLNPTKVKFYTTYVLTTVTLFSGFYLVLNKPGHIVKTCFTGLAYLTFISAGVFAAKYKLKKETTEKIIV